MKKIQRLFGLRWNGQKKATQKNSVKTGTKEKYFKLLVPGKGFVENNKIKTPFNMGSVLTTL